MHHMVVYASHGCVCITLYRLTVGSHDPSLADMQVSANMLQGDILWLYQLQGLRDALDQVTMEKNSVLSQLALQRDEMSSLANQLAEQQQRLVAITADKDHLSSELYSCQQSLVGVVIITWLP